MNVHYINKQTLDLGHIRALIDQQIPLALSEEAEQQIIRCRRYLDEKLKSPGDPVYGINTGFGDLHDVKISSGELETLQENLVMSHACGSGDEVPAEVTRLMLFLKIQSLAYGHSGVGIEMVKRLIDFYNHDILPVVYTQGSLGASGDLAPLAHLSLPLLGLGEVWYRGKKLPASEVLKNKSWQPLHLKAKEGLALLNGTQFMAAYGIVCLLNARRLSRLADIITALSADVFHCRTEPFLPVVHTIRPHKGQQKSAANIAALLRESELAAQSKSQVQDPYSFRCAPQVHGASLDTLDYIEKVLITELNSVTDNPNIFPEEDLILSGGNFHGQPLALALDYMAIALAELGSISERRTFQLMTGGRGLPRFLVAKPGLNSGLMIAQYTAAAIVSQNKQLCTPASVDSIVSSNGQEDHVSMGANAGTKALTVVQNLETILAIEWLSAAQALEFRRPARTAPFLETMLSHYRQQVPFIEQDRVLSGLIQTTKKFLGEYNPED